MPVVYPLGEPAQTVIRHTPTDLAAVGDECLQILQELELSLDDGSINQRAVHAHPSFRQGRGVLPQMSMASISRPLPAPGKRRQLLIESSFTAVAKRQTAQRARVELRGVSRLSSSISRSTIFAWRTGANRRQSDPWALLFGDLVFVSFGEHPFRHQPKRPTSLV